MKPGNKNGNDSKRSRDGVSTPQQGDTQRRNLGGSDGQIGQRRSSSSPDVGSSRSMGSGSQSGSRSSSSSEDRSSDRSSSSRRS